MKSHIMISKTFNIYCDESCHLQHDHKKFMFLGSISCAYPQVKRLTAYYLTGKDKARDKMQKKYERRIETIL